MTRVYLFVEQASSNDLKLEDWEDASPEVRRCTEDQQITVRPGSSNHLADVQINCRTAGLTLTFSMCDLWQEQSPVLASIQLSFVQDSDEDGFDFWDQMPPFGVVQLYGIKLERRSDTSEAEVQALFLLLEHFLLAHFMMYAFLESEILHIQPYIINNGSCINTFIHEGELGYRVRTFG